LLLFVSPKKKQLEHAPTATPPRERSTKKVVTVLRILSTIPTRLCNRPSASFGGTPFYRKIILWVLFPSLTTTYEHRASTLVIDYPKA